MESPHDVLRVEEDADPDAIKAAYRRRAKESHPDQGGSMEEFRRVAAAYEQLRMRVQGGADGDASTLGGEPDGAAGTGPTADPARNGNGGPGADEPAEPRVEYLDYEVLDDHGWGLDGEGVDWERLDGGGPDGGGPDGAGLFEAASAAGLDPVDHGRFLASGGDTLLEAAEGCGFTWPYSCRGGACANCAVAVVDGEVEMPPNHVLTDDLLDRGIRLSCIGVPTTEELRVVYNVKHLPDVEDLLLPPGPFREANLGD